MGSSIGKILGGEKAQPAKAAPGASFEPFTYTGLAGTATGKKDGDLGFKFDTNTFFTDAILITSPDGETTTTILLDSPNAEQSIHNFINLNTPIEDIGRLSKSGKLPNSEKKKGNVDAFGNPI